MRAGFTSMRACFVSRSLRNTKQALRAYLAGAILDRLERRTPALFKGMQIQILLNLTARAFHTPKLSVWRLAPGQALRKYAEFTRQCMLYGVGEPANLYREAFRLGGQLRRITGFTDDADIERLVFYLYRNLRIEMSGHLPGEILVRTCYFSEYYTRSQCAVMSNLDSGVIGGLLGGGELIFTERMTAGCKNCAARFTREGESG